MKKSELKQIIREEYKKLASIKEAFKSTVFTNLAKRIGKTGWEKAGIVKQLAKNGFPSVAWSELKNGDVSYGLPSSATPHRKSEDYLCFWFVDMNSLPKTRTTKQGTTYEITKWDIW